MRALVLAGLLAVYLAVPWVRWSPGQGLLRDVPRVVSGDEPHYLMMVNSLLDDGDLLLQDDYQRVRQGGCEAGEGLRGALLDHHTIVVDRASGEHAYWQRLYDWRRPLPGGSFAPLRPGLGGGSVEIPAHPAAFPALVALFVWPFRGHPPLVERAGIELVALLSGCALLALFGAARAAGFSGAEAIAAALLAGLASPLLAYARSFFTEPLLALLLTLALWAFLTRRPALCGALCFLAAAVKPPFGLIAAGWAMLRVRQGKARDEALPLLATFGIGCLFLAGFNWRLGHTLLISGTAGFNLAPGLANAGALLFSDNHGLLSFAPWAAVGLVAGARWPELVWAASPLLVILALNDAEAGGYAYGPRYFVPLLPWLALATVRAVRAASLRGRAAIGLLAALGLAVAVPGALRYRELFARPALDAFRK